jgi:DNA-directed RNA polymerase specialized sigma24 family protein
MIEEISAGKQVIRRAKHDEAQDQRDGSEQGGELFSMRRSHDEAKRIKDYAMPTDFCKIFNNHLDHLYTLALLLTADHHKAEQCFVAGLDDCTQGNPVFREWAESWAKRIVIRNAIRMISPSRNETKKTTKSYELTGPTSEADTPAAAITKLQPFHRFVYVMSVLEQYSDRECSILLDCKIEEIVGARTQALQQLASAVSLRDGCRWQPSEQQTRVNGPSAEL